MTLRGYDEYRETNIDWLGRIPAHWCTPPMYTRYSIELGKMLDTKRLTGDHALPYLRNTDVQWDDINTAELPVMDIAPNEHERFTVRHGDLLVCEGGDVGRTAVWHGDDGSIAFQKALHRLRALHPAEHPRFMCYTMRFASSSGALIAEGNPNTIPHLTGERFRLYRFPTPPLAEQLQIAAFLDRETAKIDALVTEQERLIGILREHETAMTVDAVTRGLDAGVALRPSGVDWIGDVPEHWTCHRNKVVFEEIDDRGSDGDGELLTVSHITGVTPRASKSVNMIMAETLDGYKRCRAGDLVINTMWAWMGALGCAPMDGLVSPSYNVYRIRDRDALTPDYYDLLCRIPAHRTAMQANSSGVWESRLRLYPDAFLSMRLALPPLVEQERIVLRLREASRSSRQLVAEAERGCELLAERRAALISAAVTGQIDVRHLATADAA